MYTSGTENISWEYIPPKKLTTTMLSEYPEVLEELSENTWKHETSGKKYPTIVTPKDCTRTNSPIMMPSTIFSDDEESEGLRSLYEQLILIRDRHATLKTYIRSIKAQLQQSFNIGIAELQNKRNALISQIDLAYDETFNKLCSNHREKEIKIKAKLEEVEKSLEDIESSIQKIETCGGETEKITKKIENTLKIWVSESDVNSKWAILQVPDFEYTLISIKPTEIKTSKRESRCSKNHRAHKNSENYSKDSKSKNKSFHHIIKQNYQMVERLNKLEQVFNPANKAPRPKSLLESDRLDSAVSISTLYSDPLSVVNCENKLKIYIPQGYPSYTCFYLVRVDADVNVFQVLDKLATHMRANRDSYCLKQDRPGAGKTVDGRRKAIEFVSTNLYLENI